MSGDLFSFFAAPPSVDTFSISAVTISTALPTSKRGKAVAFTIHDGEGNNPRTIWPRGRDAWALANLVLAGTHGCTPIAHPGPRWSHYVFKLRTVYGLDIETVDEPHGGPYSGTHARYVLRSRVTFADPASAAAFAEGGK